MNETRSVVARSLMIGVISLVALVHPTPPAASPHAAGGTLTSTKPVSRPPFYRGKLPTGGGQAGHVPVVVVPPPGMPANWAPAGALERLAGDLNGWLDRSGLSRPLPAVPAAAKAAPPTVYLGCSLDMTDECDEDARENVLAASSANQAWRSSIAAPAREAGVDRMLVLQLGIAPHWIHQRNLKGTKEVRLGTGYAQRLPWLTSLETPVWVMQITGAVTDVDGKVLRSGGEGIWALRTPFRASVLGAQKLLADEDVELVRTELRREELSGTPLAWEAAVHQLVVQLLGPAPVRADAGTAPAGQPAALAKAGGGSDG